ncbi:hypothetical protein U9M48_012685 [Paspalum notatum var. saurae]|uniref:CCHC-type domain-containing protein n=1 Tax=Paspalum notatum var. saurae TaxID=547442 RepID=A0AAQ3SYI6_PASNO
MWKRRLGLRTLKEVRATRVANTVESRNQGKGKGKFKPNKTTNFKKKKNKAELPCFTCGELGHFSKDCPERADRRGKRGGNGQSSKTVNTVTRDCSVLMGNGSVASFLAPVRWIRSLLRERSCD